MSYKVYISPEDRASNKYHAGAVYNGSPTNEKEQMCRCADLLAGHLTRCGFEVKNVQTGNMYDRVKESNAWGADLHIALHTNGFDGTADGTRVHCYPSEKSRKIGALIQNAIAPLSPGTHDKLVESKTLYELRAPRCPAVLPEYGFHDNPVEAQWLVNKMDEIAELTARAICEFFGVEWKPERKAPVLYRIQVGAFKNKKNAAAYLETLKKLGVNGFIVEV